MCRILRTVAVLLPLLYWCGCASLPEREDLELSLVNVALGDSTVWETTAVFTVRLGNGSPDPLILDGSVYKFYLNGLYIGEGLSGDRLEIPRFSSATQDVTVHLSNVSMAARVRSILQNQAVEYRVTSKLYLLTRDRSTRVRLAHEGRLSVEDFRPPARPR